MNRMKSTITLLMVLIALPRVLSCALKEKVDYVIFIVFDGLRPDTVADNLNVLPNFKKLREHGAFTDNARAEFKETQTAPTHWSMWTGDPIEKHGYSRDEDIGGKYTSYDESIFNLVHENGMRGCMFAGKEKFDIFRRSLPMSYYNYFKQRDAVTGAFLNVMKNAPCNFSFVHLIHPDAAGHKYKGAKTKLPDGTIPYFEAVKDVDVYLGEILDFVEKTSPFKDNTLIIATSDHGFADEGNHAQVDLLENYKIPFYTLGPCVEPGADLYELNTETRKNPLDSRTPSFGGIQPIRNRDAGPLAADALGITTSKGTFSDKNANLYLGVDECRGDCSDGGDGGDGGDGDTNPICQPENIVCAVSSDCCDDIKFRCHRRKKKCILRKVTSDCKRSGGCGSSNDCCSGFRCHRKKKVCVKKRN